MQTIEIKLNRTGSVISRMMPYQVWFNGAKLGKTLHDGDSVFTVNREKGVLRVRELGSKFAFHAIQKEIVIFPDNIAADADRLECDVTATVNWLGALTFGLLAPLRRIKIDIKY